MLETNNRSRSSSLVRMSRRRMKGRKMNFLLLKVRYSSLPPLLFPVHTGRECRADMTKVPAVKTTGRKRAAPAPAAPIAPAAKKGRKSAQPAEETEVAPKAAKGRAGSAAAPEVVIEKKKEETEEVVLPKSRRGRKKKEEAVVEIAETQDVNMYDAGAEVVSKTPPQKPKDRFWLEEWRTNEAEARLAEFVKNSEDIQAGTFARGCGRIDWVLMCGGVDSQRLIDALQADVEAQTALAAGSRTLTKKLAAKEAENAKLSVKIAELNKTIATAQKDNQMLQAKLTAAETSRVPVPGSAVKPGRGGVAVMAGSAGDQAWKAHVKEELYRDLTNLVIMGIKKEADTQVFECLQTGVNGSKSFFARSKL